MHKQRSAITDKLETKTWRVIYENITQDENRIKY